MSTLSALDNHSRIQFKIVCNVKFNNFDQNYPMIATTETGAFQFHGMGPTYGCDKGKVTFYIETTSGKGDHGRGVPAIVTPKALQTNKWHRLVVIKRLNSLTIKVDGQSTTTDLGDDITCGEFEMKPTGKIFVGSNCPKGPLEGAVKNFRIVKIGGGGGGGAQVNQKLKIQNDRLKKRVQKLRQRVQNLKKKLNEADDDDDDDDDDDEILTRPIPQFALDRRVDVAVVGGGFGGAYTSFRLISNAQQEGGKLTVACFEARGRIGGRLFSLPSPDPAVEDELGGMRIFPDSQPYITTLVKMLGKKLNPRPLADADNIFYSLGEGCLKKDYKYKREDGTELKLSELEQIAWDNFQKLHPGEPNYTEDPHKAWDSEILRKLGFREFYRKYGLTRKEVQEIVAWSGYDLYPEEVSIAVYKAHSGLYGSEETSHYFVEDGYQSIVIGMVDVLLKEAPEQFYLQDGANVISIQDTSSTDYPYSLLFEDEGDPWFAKKVVLSITKEELGLIQLEALPKARIEKLRSVVSLPLFKCFLVYDKETKWWDRASGKTTTDLHLRQVHYYDSNTLLVYNSGEHAVWWGEQFNKNVEVAQAEMLEMLREVHGKDVIPPPLRFRWKFWSDGSHKWAKGFDVKKTRRELVLGEEDCFFVGDALSMEQGWVEGAITTCELVLQEKFGLPDLPLIDADDEKIAKFVQAPEEEKSVPPMFASLMRKLKKNKK